ncbi:UNVERIFIED_CONTAM: hypothetical protein Sangu_2154900 [Sesamum angustifolium]|uniref:Uncharacterized protein n=1 Tax=Sesamum angustifolium TaxID=2727405 RepID=A0AAW2LGU3_9LAMI
MKTKIPSHGSRLLQQVVKAEPLSRITENEIQDWCGKRSIQQRFTSVAHLQANGKVEVTNCILVQGIKIKLEEASGQWVNTLLDGHIELLHTPPQEKLLSI